MSFIWPTMLILLALVPLGVLLYIRLQRRRRRFSASHGGFGMVQDEGGARLRLRRHIPALFFLAGLVVVILAVARPQMLVSLPRLEGTVILAFDVSGSMAADDLQPNRMAAAKTAALDFVSRQPSSVQIGVVAFSEGGFAVAPPTNDPQAIAGAIQRLEPERGTSLADGILASLEVITGENAALLTGGEDAPVEIPPTPTPMPAGSNRSAAIVLLTDGENTSPPDPFAVAQIAADRGVKIYTIGIGSRTGATIEVDGYSVFTQLDEPTLEQIAQISGGEYFYAENEEDLQKVYQALAPQLVVKAQKTEVTSIFAGASLLFLLAGGAISLLWFSRIP